MITINTVVLPRKIRFSEENPIYFLCFTVTLLLVPKEFDRWRSPKKRGKGEKKKRKKITSSLFFIIVNFIRPLVPKLNLSRRICLEHIISRLLTIITNTAINLFHRIFSCVSISISIQNKREKEERSKRSAFFFFFLFSRER